jgi:hypothetical protein
LYVFVLQVVPGESIVLSAVLRRDAEEEEEEEEGQGGAVYGRVVCPRYPAPKGEGWWLIVGDSHGNNLLSIKRFTLNKEAKVRFCAYFIPKFSSSYSFINVFLRLSSNFPPPKTPETTISLCI